MTASDGIDSLAWARRREQEDEFLRYVRSALYQSDGDMRKFLREAVNHGLSEVELPVKKPYGDVALSLGILAFDFQPLRATGNIATALNVLSTSTLVRFGDEALHGPFAREYTERRWRDEDRNMNIRYCHGLVRDGRAVKAVHKDAPLLRFFRMAFEPLAEGLSLVPLKSPEKALTERR